MAETKYNWSHPDIPDWVNWITTDGDKRVYGYYNKPEKKEPRWCAGIYNKNLKHQFIRLPKIKPYNGPWDESLEQNPLPKKYDWDNWKVVTWVKYLTTDKDGRVKCFQSYPKKEISTWENQSPGGSWKYLNIKGYDGPWEESLEERPV